MKPLDLLREEHRLLASLLDSLDALLRRARREDRLDPESAVEILELFERSFDGLHQEREERVLFPWIRARAPQALRPTIAGLVREHGHERVLLDELRARLEPAAYGDPLSRDSFVLCGEAYLALQRAHLAHEEAFLLPLAEAVLDAADEPELMTGFASLERASSAPGPQRLRERVTRVGRANREPVPCG